MNDSTAGLAAGIVLSAAAGSVICLLLTGDVCSVAIVWLSIYSAFAAIGSLTKKK